MVHFSQILLLGLLAGNVWGIVHPEINLYVYKEIILI